MEIEILDFPRAIQGTQLRRDLLLADPLITSTTFLNRTNTIRVSSTGNMEATLMSIINGHNSLTLNATLASITANGIQETSLTSAGLNSFNYRVWKEGAIVASGSINDGSLDFSTNEGGVYLIELISGNNTGYKEIIANG